MIHDLVVQLPITGRWGTDAEMDLRNQLEEGFGTALGGLGEVTGSDVGSGNMNIFINQIRDVDPALEVVKAVLGQHAALDKAIIQRTTFENESGNEDDEENEPAEEVVVWPENFTGVFRLF